MPFNIPTTNINKKYQFWPPDIKNIRVLTIFAFYSYITILRIHKNMLNDALDGFRNPQIKGENCKTRILMVFISCLLYTSDAADE